MKYTISKILLLLAWLLGAPAARAAITDAHATGIADGVVYLNDLQDHSWTLYQGVPAEVDKTDTYTKGYYNTQYINKLYFPNPCDIKITYYGNGTNNMLADNGTTVNGSASGVQVGLTSDGETQNTFVYYKTLEPISEVYTYRTIPNPFYVRPTLNSNYYGFAGWRILSASGINAIKNSTRTTTLWTSTSTGVILDGDVEYVFEPTSAGADMAIELEAIWRPATVVHSNSSLTSSNSKGTVERNFVVLSGNSLSLTLAQYPATYTTRYPDGTLYGSDATRIYSISFPTSNRTTYYADYKIEYIKMNMTSGTLTAGDGTTSLTVGRGVTAYSSLCANVITGLNTSSKTSYTSTVNFHLRVESGTYNYMGVLGDYYSNRTGTSANGLETGTASSISASSPRIRVTLGSDYDRANNGNNSNLSFTYSVMLGSESKFASGNQKNEHTFEIVFKSGEFGTTYFVDGNNTSNTTYMQGNVGCEIYLGVPHNSNNYIGRKTAYIEGGKLCTIGGGCDVPNTTSSTTDFETLFIRMTGGTVSGNIHGGAANDNTQGLKRIIITGGTVKGWVAAGCNGTSATGGTNYGESFVYIGGKGKIDSRNTSGTTSTMALGYANGGSVFAAGAGHNTSTTSGIMNEGTNLVVADEAVVERGIYGGGNYGYANTESHTYLYITGGTNLGTEDTAVTGSTAKGAVYGGSNRKGGPKVNIYMTGGNMLGGVYGGSNTSGTVTGVNMKILGGTVGESTMATANVNGGGLGSSTIVSGDVAVEVGEHTGPAVVDGALTNVLKSALIYGDVYGGSESGIVNGTSTTGSYDSSKNTHVTLSGGTVNGDLYGGGNGADGEANVYGNVLVDITGGTVTGSVFGCNNTQGAPQGPVTVNVTVPITVDAVTEAITHNVNLNNVYGGGNAASYTYAGNYPAVNFISGYAQGRVYGGGYGVDAIVTGNPAVTIGDWLDPHQVTIDKNVFGGGAKAAVEGNVAVTINDCETIIKGDVYGGGDDAPVYSTNTLINGGLIYGNVFGGGNGKNSSTGYGAQVGYAPDNTTEAGSGNAATNVLGGTIGTWSTGTDGSLVCADETGGIFGGSNTLGNIRGYINLNIDQGDECPLKVSEAYGAGNEAAYYGMGVTLTMGCIDGFDYVYGGAKKTDYKGDIDLKVTSGTFKAVYGGNNLGGVIDGTITVTIDETGCKPLIIGDVYGGGNQATYDANGRRGPIINVISCTSIGNIYGGGYLAGVTANPEINIQQIPGIYAYDELGVADALGPIGNVYGGGNQAVVNGSTTVNIATISEQAHVTGDDTATTYSVGANIAGDVFGGGNNGAVTGQTHVQIGPEP